MKPPYKFLFGVFLVVLAAIAGYGLFFYFIPVKAPSGRHTDLSVTEDQVLRDFDSSSETAIAKYKEKIVEISGIIKKTEIQGNVNNVIFDKGGASILVTTCMPEDSSKVKALVPGEKILLKGIYKGFIKGDDVFGTPAEIKIDQCIILK